MKKHLALQWHLTDDCDQRCRHCYIWQSGFKPKKSPTLNECEIIIQKYVDFCEEKNRIPYFSLTGGDPLLYPFIWQMLELIKQRNIEFSLLGNPFHLTDEVASRLKGLSCPKYQMSLDGLEKTHDYMRKPGSFKTTINAIPTIIKSGMKPIIMSTVSLVNYKELPDLARLCVELKVNTFSFARYCPTHSDVENNIPPLVYREFLGEMWKVYEELVDAGTSFDLKDHLWTAFLYEKGLYKLGNWKDGCHCGNDHLTLLPNGTVYACRRFESPVGNIYQQSFKDIFSSSKMNEYRQIKKLAGCKDCKLLNYCRGCHAVSAGTTGKFFDKDPQCWKC